MTYTAEQIAAVIQALPPENRPVIRAIIGELQSELERVEDEYRQLLNGADY